MIRDPSVARRLWQRLELVHQITYFSPEALGALRDAGYKGFWMGYFAGRAAPLGAVGPEVVMALFYNFAPSRRVARALPDAWTFAPPEAALTARLSGSVAALRRICGDVDVSAAAALARRAAEAAPLEGRALFAANAALPWPDEPFAVLWHAATLLREHRGDGHVAALTAAGVRGRQANVLHATAVGTPPELLTIGRDYDDEEWNANVSALAERDLMSLGGDLTENGTALHDELEALTDRIALPAYDVLDDGEIEELQAALTPVARTIVAHGDLPTATPVGAIADAFD